MESEASIDAPVAGATVGILRKPRVTDLATLRQNLRSVRARVASAAARGGRAGDAVRVVAVTKSVGPAEILGLLREGHGDFGENRPQQLAARAGEVAAAAAADPALAGRPARWHMIGHFQRNKVRRTLPLVHLVHSLDSWELGLALDREASREGRVVDALVQVNASGETTKGGFAPEELPAALARLGALASLRLLGLMTMAPFVEDPETVRPVFRVVRELRDEAAASGYLRGSELSMGMSEDFEVAVEEGSTIVRIGRALVGEAGPTQPGADICRT